MRKISADINLERKLSTVKELPMGKLMPMGTQRLKRIAGRLLKKPFHAILSCEEITGGGKYALPFSD